MLDLLVHLQTMSRFSTAPLSLLLFAACQQAANTEVVTITLGQDIDYPPYAFATDDGELAGFGKDIADGMTALCDNLDIIVVEERWANCWSSADGGSLGASVADGTIDGCMTYTHTYGVRDQLAEFSHGILRDNKAAGLLTLLDADGNPLVNGMDDLSGKKIIDVGGWAPTADGLGFVTNFCTESGYSNDYELLVADGDVANDVAIKMLRDGEGDAIFIYADQVSNYMKCPNGATWNCTLWEGFGTEYAFVQSGQFGHAINGTTLVLSPKGSGIKETLGPCLEQFLATQDYYDLCIKYNLVGECLPNKFFPTQQIARSIEDRSTDEQTGDCSNGFCPCPVSNISGAKHRSFSLVAGAVLLVISYFTL